MPGPTRGRDRGEPGCSWGGGRSGESPFSPHAWVKRERRLWSSPAASSFPKLGTSGSDRRRAGTRILLAFPSPATPHPPVVPGPAGKPRHSGGEKGRTGSPPPQPSASERFGVPRRPRPREGRSGRDHLQRWRRGETRRGRGAGPPFLVQIA